MLEGIHMHDIGLWIPAFEHLHHLRRGASGVFQHARVRSVARRVWMPETAKAAEIEGAGGLVERGVFLDHRIAFCECLHKTHVGRSKFLAEKSFFQPMGVGGMMKRVGDDGKARSSLNQSQYT